MSALAKIREYLGSLRCHGTITAGHPVAVSSQADRLETFDMENLRLPMNKRTFSMRVHGNSMVNAGILNGDIVIFEFEKELHSGAIVAALMDGESTLKRYIKSKGKVYLMAENADFPLFIPAQELVIQGVFVGLIRLPA